MSAPPFVTIAVPTHDRGHRLPACLTSLLALDYPRDRYEILVIDDGSRDETAAVVGTFVASTSPRVSYHRQEHRGVNTARNLAFRHAAGDPVCFVDDDEEVPPGWLSALVAGADHHADAECVGGPMRLRLDGPAPRHCGGEPLGESELDLGPHPVATEYVWGGNMAIRRAAIARIGPFREDLVLLGGTETEWQERLRSAGGTVMYVPDAWLWHVRTADELRVPHLLLRHFARGRGQAINAARTRRRPYSHARIARSLATALAHAATARCTVGLIDAARHLGRLVGLLEAAARAAR